MFLPLRRLLKKGTLVLYQVEVLESRRDDAQKTANVLM